MSSLGSDPVVVEVVRSGFVESVHHGRIAITAPDGSLVAGLGDVASPFFPRSASKPLQAVGMVRLGLDLTGELLALTCGSHTGEPFHVDGVRAMLARSRLTEDALQTPPDWPIDDEARLAEIVAGRTQRPITMNCSGKHAGMITTAMINDWPIEDYLDPGHPVQQGILAAIADLTGDRPAAVAIDGCGAPLVAVTLTGLARAFGRIAGATGRSPEARVAEAIRAHPQWVSGTHRDEYALHQAVPGLVAKSGAEAVYAAGLPDGRGIAIKINDGSQRARPVLLAELLLRLGFDHETVRQQARPAVLGHGAPVGEIRAVLPKDWTPRGAVFPAVGHRSPESLR
ncbi:asparaginase [Microlunatus speluncae]|uniref:asparaginase n=1 Tax=Microlunatus speluncae TaxID=2594267 RepID=UPI001FE5BC78|nr:asparaginase [Microlunatus speluncae]